MVVVLGRPVRHSSSSLRIESWKSNCKNLCRDEIIDNNSVESKEMVAVQQNASSLANVFQTKKRTTNAESRAV